MNVVASWSKEDNDVNLQCFSQGRKRVDEHFTGSRFDFFDVVFGYVCSPSQLSDTQLASEAELSDVHRDEASRRKPCRLVVRLVLLVLHGDQSDGLASRTWWSYSRASSSFAPLFSSARGIEMPREIEPHDPSRIDLPGLDRGSHWQSVLVADVRPSKEVLNAVRIDREIVRRPPGVREHDRRA